MQTVINGNLKILDHALCCKYFNPNEFGFGSVADIICNKDGDE
jgi:hypothetical protein